MRVLSPKKTLPKLPDPSSCPRCHTMGSVGGAEAVTGLLPACLSVGLSAGLPVCCGCGCCCCCGGGCGGCGCGCGGCDLAPKVSAARLGSKLRAAAPPAALPAPAAAPPADADAEPGTGGPAAAAPGLSPGLSRHAAAAGGERGEGGERESAERISGTELRISGMEIELALRISGTEIVELRISDTEERISRISGLVR